MNWILNEGDFPSAQNKAKYNLHRQETMNKDRVSEKKLNKTNQNSAVLTYLWTNGFLL